VSRYPPDPEQGVFETLLVRGGRAQALERHLARLRASLLSLYGAELQPPEFELPRDPHRLRIDAHADGTATASLTPIDLAAMAHPVAVEPVTVRGGLGPHKWRDRDWLQSQPGVPLLVDADGSVLEAAWANVWVIEGGRLITPAADGRILPGVTRELLLELDFPTAVEPVGIDRLLAAEAVFLTSALRHAVAAHVGVAPASEPPAVAEVRAALASVEWSR
jgi:para-aminobenzoate synthetase/4-amino-4-deoxychorismate lyase